MLDHPMDPEPARPSAPHSPPREEVLMKNRLGRSDERDVDPAAEDGIDHMFSHELVGILRVDLVLREPSHVLVDDAPGSSLDHGGSDREDLSSQARGLSVDRDDQLWFCVLSHAAIASMARFSDQR